MATRVLQITRLHSTTREGRNDFFAQFLEVLKDQEGPAVEVDPGAIRRLSTGLLLGTRQVCERNSVINTLTWIDLHVALGP